MPWLQQIQIGVNFNSKLVLKNLTPLCIWVRPIHRDEEFNTCNYFFNYRTKLQYYYRLRTMIGPLECQILIFNF